MANMNIFGKDWMDLIFKGRNKEYGAYELRKKSNKHTLLALILGTLFMGLAFGSKLVYDRIDSQLSERKKANDETIEVIEVVMPIEEVEPPVEEIIEEEPIPEEPEPAGASKSVQDEVEFKEIEVKEDDKVTNELKTSQEDFDDETTSGQLTQEGDKDDGDLKDDGKNTGLASKGSEGSDRSDTFTDKPDNTIYRFVQQKAEPMNGEQSFRRDFGRKFRAPEVPSNVNQVSITLRFVVEKDGSLTDIKALDNKYGVGDEAIRVLRTMPKWKPAKQGGNVVRSSFTWKITLAVN